MTKLSQPQTALLHAAAKTADGVDASPDAAKSATALIRKGLLISLPRDGAPSRLMITAAGREAIGLPLEPAASQRAAPAADAAPSGDKHPKGKLGVVVTMLLRPQGATIAQLSAATAWQAHSVRGAIAGSIKKKLGLAVTSAPAEGGRVYRIGEGAGA